jgi:putative glutamine amidotransferase
MERLGRGATHPAATRTFGPKQDHDFELVGAAREVGLPVLGICYGMQLLCLAEGGELLQHLPEDRPGAQPHAGDAVHDVAVGPGTKLEGALGVERLPVISRHHQAVLDAGPGLEVSARDDEGLIEAVEKPAHPFYIGVQWHPELSPASSPHGRLFRALVAAAARHAAGPLPADPSRA